MFGLFRKLLGFAVRLWLCLIQAICRKKQQEHDQNGKSSKWSSVAANEDSWETEGWESFSVKVVPNSEEEKDPQQPVDGHSEQACGELATQQHEDDLFEDMKPVFRKPKKIQLHSKAMDQRQVNFSKFAVQDSVFRQETVGELGTWSEDDETEGWEEGLDEGKLVMDSQEALRKKKAHEREKRRKAQELLRTQQRALSSIRLGTKVT